MEHPSIPEPTKMESAFSWLGKLAEWLGKLVPKLGICRATHGGVKFVRGSKVKEIKPGLYVYWPLTTEIVVVPTVRQTINLVSQVLVTKDGKSVTAGATIIFTISDIKEALSNTWDLEHCVCDIAQAAVVDTITRIPLNGLISELNGKVIRELTNKVGVNLKEFGLSVKKCLLTDFSPCVVIKFLGDKQ